MKGRLRKPRGWGIHRRGLRGAYSEGWVDTLAARVCWRDPAGKRGLHRAVVLEKTID